MIVAQKRTYPTSQKRSRARRRCVVIAHNAKWYERHGVFCDLWQRVFLNYWKHYSIVGTHGFCIRYTAFKEKSVGSDNGTTRSPYFKRLFGRVVYILLKAAAAPHVYETNHVYESKTKCYISFLLSVLRCVVTCRRSSCHLPKKDSNIQTCCSVYITRNDQIPMYTKTFN